MSDEIKYHSNPREDLLPYIPPQLKKTLDVGCAEGKFSYQLKQKGVEEAWGVELYDAAALEAAKKLDRVLSGSFDDVYDQLPKSYFDCVFFNDVLEHMIDPESCLIKVKDLLKPNGYIVASIPNVSHVDVLKMLLLDKDWKYEDSGIMDRTHLRFFTKKSIKRMFINCGYQVNQFDGIHGVGKHSLTYIVNKLFFGSFSNSLYRQYVVVASCKY